MKYNLKVEPRMITSWKCYDEFTSVLYKVVWTTRRLCKQRWRGQKRLVWMNQ